MDRPQLRNIGISAHIDSGKTTLSERILYYTGRIHKMEDVHGGGAGATMDHMELEKERGITITCATTSVQWDQHEINLIDTPGHVDFTVEVERSLRVLDGAILVLCAVGGVQSQSMTVDRQMKRYHVPRLAFINKMDRAGADPMAVMTQVRDKLDCDAILMQLPIGTADAFVGVIDLVSMDAKYFDGDQGESVRCQPIPASLADEARNARQGMLEALSMYSDELMELLLSEEEVPEELIHRVTRSATIGQDATPVYVGSAYRNKGVQPLLDAVVRYLPSPSEHELTANNRNNPDEKVSLTTDPDQPLVAMAFKIVDDPYGQLTFVRIYQGTIRKGDTVFNQRTVRKERCSRIVKMHADQREDVESAVAGDIVAIMGIDAASGDTYARQANYCTLESIYVPDPVIKMAIEPTSRDAFDRLGKALARFRKEDPTFRVTTDEETGETVIAGMGELHLEVYVERIRREYKVDVEVGAPKVSYRETAEQACPFNFRHKKQTGGAGQFAHIIGQLEPLPDEFEEPFEFEERVAGGRVPKQYIPAVRKGFLQAMAKGPMAQYPIVGIKAVLEDGSHHEVDSSEMAFQIAARNCFRETFLRMKPVLLEPVMRLEVESPQEFQGTVTGELGKRRGLIISTEVLGKLARIIADVPLAETFGYATDLRSMTQGLGTFTMELARYRKVPPSIQEEIVAEAKNSLIGAK